MTTKKQLIRIIIIVLVLIGTFFAGREIYYARKVNQQSVQIKLDSVALTKNSFGIIIGTVEKSLGTKRFIDDNGEVMINTRWQVKVEKVYKGNVSNSVIVQTPGGRYGLTEVVAEDAPTLTKEDKVLLYLSPWRNSGEYQITGQFQGKFNVSKANDGTEIFTQQETGNIKTVSELENELKTTNS